MPSFWSLHKTSLVDTGRLYREIFREGCYAPVIVRPGATILDIGANVGLFGLWCREQVNDAWRSAEDRLRIVAVEPGSLAFGCLAKNLPGATLIEAAVRDFIGQTYFFQRARYSQASGAHRWSDEELLVHSGLPTWLPRWLRLKICRWHVKETLSVVDVTTVSALIEAFQLGTVDVLKVDVEKDELAVFDGIQDGHWKRIQQIVVECHGQAECAEVKRRLGRWGFAVEETSNHGLLILFGTQKE